MRVIDLTHTITEGMPVFPGAEPPRFESVASCETDGYRETRISLFTHTGTHMDPPAHIFSGRATLDAFPPEQFIGRALVIDCRSLPAGAPITTAQLAPYGEKVDRAEFLLFHLGWDRLWGTDAYYRDYPCLDDAVLDYILGGAYKGIGFDALSLDPVADANVPRHKRLFREKNIVNIENLCRLEQCGSELFWFSCFPLKLADCDGSPIRAVAWFDE